MIIGEWYDYGSIGFIDAAKKHAECANLPWCRIDVRDADDPSRPVGKFYMQRVVTYEVLNPRQGTKDDE